MEANVARRAAVNGADDTAPLAHRRRARSAAARTRSSASSRPRTARGGGGRLRLLARLLCRRRSERHEPGCRKCKIPREQLAPRRRASFKPSRALGHSGPPAAASLKPWVKTLLPDGNELPSLRIFCSLESRDTMSDVHSTDRRAPAGPRWRGATSAAARPGRACRAPAGRSARAG